jgi:hypothetical protein
MVSLYAAETIAMTLLFLLVSVKLLWGRLIACSRVLQTAIPSILTFSYSLEELKNVSLGFRYRMKEFFVVYMMRVDLLRETALR